VGLAKDRPTDGLGERHAGFAGSGHRPGGNITGFVTFETSINTKYLQLLKEMAPQVTHVSVLQTRASSWRGDFAVIEAVARSFAVAPVTTLIPDDPGDVERAIASFAQQSNGGLILPPDGITFKHRTLIVALAAKHLLPASIGTVCSPRPAA
jgi:putative ABC transport system substrate-binding protein